MAILLAAIRAEATSSTTVLSTLNAIKRIFLRAWHPLNMIPTAPPILLFFNYADGEKRYILAPQGLKVGDSVQTSDEPPFAVGSCMKLKFMPLGSVICNIEMIPGKGGKMVRSAGLSAQLMARSGGYATLRMPSGEMRMVNENCRATFGAVSNPENNLRSRRKSGTYALERGASHSSRYSDEPC